MAYTYIPSAHTLGSFSSTTDLLHKAIEFGSASVAKAAIDPLSALSADDRAELERTQRPHQLRGARFDAMYRPANIHHRDMLSENSFLHEVMLAPSHQQRLNRPMLGMMMSLENSRQTAENYESELGEIARLLVAGGINPHVKNSDQKMAADLAFENRDGHLNGRAKTAAEVVVQTLRRQPDWQPNITALLSPKDKPLKFEERQQLTSHINAVGGLVTARLFGVVSPSDATITRNLSNKQAAFWINQAWKCEVPTAIPATPPAKKRKPRSKPAANLKAG